MCTVHSHIEAMHPKREVIFIADTTFIVFPGDQSWKNAVKYML